jgi:hypothetical protein
MSGLKDALAGIKEAQSPGPQAPRLSSAQAPTARVEPRALPLQGTAKSKHPEYEPVKIYVRKRTRKDAWRKWEDAQGGDFSDLVQMLLDKYLGT